MKAGDLSKEVEKNCSAGSLAAKIGSLSSEFTRGIGRFCRDSSLGKLVSRLLNGLDVRWTTKSLFAAVAIVAVLFAVVAWIARQPASERSLYSNSNLHDGSWNPPYYMVETAVINDDLPTVGILLRSEEDWSPNRLGDLYTTRQDGRTLLNNVLADIPREHFILFAGYEVDQLTRIELDANTARRLLDAQRHSNYREIHRLWKSHVQPRLDRKEGGQSDKKSQG